MPASLARIEACCLFGPPVPGVGPIIHIEDHGSFIIAVRWDGEETLVPWARRAEADADWYQMQIH